MLPTKLLRHALFVACAAALTSSGASAAIIFSDGFGDGDRDNNGLDAGAAVTDATDVGIAWYGVGGTSAVTHIAVDDSAGIGSGNAMRVFNTASNNRPHVGPFTANAVSLNDGDSIILRFDVRLAQLTNSTGGAVTSANRAFRFGLYNDNGTTVNGDKGSTDTTDQDDVGEMAEIDVGPDASDSTTMDVKRDDSSAGTLIGGTATTITGGPSSTNTANQLLISSTGKSHYELMLTRSGTSLLISLQKDANGAITGTDATPPTFTFNEVMLGPRSSAAQDLFFDNIQVEYIAAIPEPATLGLAGLGTLALAARRRSR